jgi:hypothetical protein
MRRVVIVKDKMQQGYRYEVSAPARLDFDPQFRPDLTPEQMLELGVFCGKYLTDCQDEYPASWFARAKLSPSGRDCSFVRIEDLTGGDARADGRGSAEPGWLQYVFMMIVDAGADIAVVYCGSVADDHDRGIRQKL